MEKRVRSSQRQIYNGESLDKAKVQLPLNRERSVKYATSLCPERLDILSF